MPSPRRSHPLINYLNNLFHFGIFGRNKDNISTPTNNKVTYRSESQSRRSVVAAVLLGKSTWRVSDAADVGPVESL